MKKITITLDEEVFKNFKELADIKGIKISTWVNIKMKEIVMGNQDFPMTEKQTPYKPYDDGYGWQCKCGTPLNKYVFKKTKTTTDFCYNCGQKLKWN